MLPLSSPAHRILPGASKERDSTRPVSLLEPPFTFFPVEMFTTCRWCLLFPTCKPPPPAVRTSVISQQQLNIGGGGKNQIAAISCEEGLETNPDHASVVPPPPSCYCSQLVLLIKNNHPSPSCCISFKLKATEKLNIYTHQRKLIKLDQIASFFLMRKYFGIFPTISSRINHLSTSPKWIFQPCSAVTERTTQRGQSFNLSNRQRSCSQVAQDQDLAETGFNNLDLT